MTPKERQLKRGVDWEAVHRRLAQALAASEGSIHLSPEQARAVMDERARALAQVPVPPPRASEVIQVTTFALANERYAIEARYIRRVLRMSESTPVPGAPAFLVGLINLRGEILAVIDLRTFFGLARDAETDLSRVIVLGDERDEFGVLADAVEEMVTIRVDDIHEPPGSVTGIGRQYLRGVTMDALVVLDGAVLFKDARLFIDQGEETGA